MVDLLKSADKTNELNRIFKKCIDIAEEQEGTMRCQNLTKQTDYEQLGHRTQEKSVTDAPRFGDSKKSAGKDSQEHLADENQLDSK